MISSKSLFASFAALLVSASSAFSAITIIISPVGGDPNSATFQASGSGGISNDDMGGATTNPANRGAIAFSETVFPAGVFGGTQAGLSYGGSAINNIQIIGSGILEITTADLLATDAVYSFSGGPITITLNDTFDETFNSGNYTITGGTGTTGSSPSGSLTIVPEPSASLCLIAAAGLFAQRRRRA